MTFIVYTQIVLFNKAIYESTQRDIFRIPELFKSIKSVPISYGISSSRV